MTDLDSFFHKKFKYVLIPQDADEPIRELEFEGREGNFRNVLKNHFTKNTLTNPNGLASSIHQQHNSASADQIRSAMNAASSTYQIIPLTLPNKAANYIGINAYVDDVGQFKDYKLNARATRILSSECKGDCFISKTFDDEDLFERRDFSMSEYEEFLKTPPNPKGRWDPSMSLMGSPTQALTNIVSNAEEIKKAKEQLGKLDECAGCHKSAEDAGKTSLSRCGRCKNVAYCGIDCQKNDWKLHKKACATLTAS